MTRWIVKVPVTAYNFWVVKAQDKDTAMQQWESGEYLDQLMLDEPIAATDALEIPEGKEPEQMSLF